MVFNPSWLIPPRRDSPELLDMGVGSPDEVARSLRDLHRVNTLLGGTWSLTRFLYPRIRKQITPVTVVDVGAGAGDITHTIQTWAKQQQKSVTVIPLDLTTRHLRHVRQSATVHPLQANALSLPLPPNSVDFVVSSLFLHHFMPDQIVMMLRSFWRAARRGIIMSDLVRGKLPEVGWHFVRPVFARSWITAHDGLVSVQRSYTPDEFTALAQLAGIESPIVHTQFPWRMILVAEKPHV
jgi:hypothetical protein